MMKRNCSSKVFFIAICVVLLFMACSLAAEEDITKLAQAVLAEGADAGTKTVVSRIPDGINGKISLDLRSIDVVDALKFLAMKAGLNIITTKNVTGRITLTVEDVVVNDIFDIMLRSNKLAYMKQGDIYNIMTEDEYNALFGKKFFDIRQVKAFRLQYAIPEQAFTLLDTLKSDIGRILVEPDSGTALIMDTPESIMEIEKALVTLEKKNLVQVFNLSYARAKDVEEQLKAQIDLKKIGSIKADERSNLVIVQALPERMPEIENLIKALDTKTKQVLIDAKIIKVKLTDQLDAGFEWEGLQNLGKQLGMTYIGSTPFAAVRSTSDAWVSRESVAKGAVSGINAGSIGSYASSGYSTSYASSRPKTIGDNMHVGIVGSKVDLDVVFKYLQTLGNAQILSNPKLAVINNQEARIHVGERQAYVTSTTTTGQTTTTVSEEVTFVDVGIQLSVTPTINDDGYVTMKIKPEISSVTSTLITQSKNSIPIIDTSMAETTVLVRDGSTIIIGGLRREEKSDSTKQVPLLGKIPLLGLLFRSSTTKTDRTELLIMFTPYIVEGDVLTTGDERDFGYKPGKDYIGYDSFTKETDFPVTPEDAPEEKVKPYREYRSFKATVEDNYEESDYDE